MIPQGGTKSMLYRHPKENDVKGASMDQSFDDIFHCLGITIIVFSPENDDQKWSLSCHVKIWPSTNSVHVHVHVYLFILLLMNTKHRVFVQDNVHNILI